MKPNDWCVANRTVKGKQLTVVWHVNNLKISHVESDIFKEMISQLSKLYGKEAELTINRGKVHE